MQGEYARLFEMGYRAGRGMGRLATAAHFIAHAKNEQQKRRDTEHERDEERRERALARARDGDLPIVNEAGGIKVCGIDRTVLYLDEVPGWANFTRWVCATCGRERMNVDEEEGATDERHESRDPGVSRTEDRALHGAGVHIDGARS